MNPLVLTQYEGQRDETGILVTVDGQFLKEPSLLFVQEDPGEK